MEKCNKDQNCKGYMQRMADSDPKLNCGIVTTTPCTEFSFSNNSGRIDCDPKQTGHTGELLNTTCPADFIGFWTGCYKKFGKCRFDIYKIKIIIKQ